MSTVPSRSPRVWTLLFHRQRTGRGGPCFRGGQAPGGGRRRGRPAERGAVRPRAHSGPCSLRAGAAEARAVTGHARGARRQGHALSHATAIPVRPAAPRSRQSAAFWRPRCGCPQSNRTRAHGAFRMGDVAVTLMAGKKWERKKARLVRKGHRQFEMTVGIVMGLRHTVRQFEVRAPRDAGMAAHAPANARRCRARSSRRTSMRCRRWSSPWRAPPPRRGTGCRTPSSSRTTAAKSLPRCAPSRA
jgi:hypothetical protein